MVSGIKSAWRRAGLVLFVLALTACAPRETLLAVHANATTRTAPDLAVVTLGVLARGANAGAAQQAQNTRMQAVLAAARAAGAQEADVQTVNFSLQPQYAYPRNAAPRITGYESRNTVSIRLSDLNAVSRLIDATVAQGANELQGIEFTYRDEEASREAARAQALQTARRRAETYAHAAGLKVDHIQSIVEPGADILPPAPRRVSFDAVGGALAEQAANAPINPGQLDNAASVTVVFALR